MSFLTSTFQSWEKTCYNITPLLKIYNMMYTKIVKKEVFLGGFTSEDIILNIGCGAAPFTAIHLKNLTGAKIIAIDKDTEALEKASYVIANMGLKKDIELVEADALLHLPTTFTAALTALQVEPKKEILDKLISNGEKGARFVFRQPKSLLKSQYDYLETLHPPVSEVSQSMKTFDKSILYIKDKYSDKYLSHFA